MGDAVGTTDLAGFDLLGEDCLDAEGGIDGHGEGATGRGDDHCKLFDGLLHEGFQALEEGDHFLELVFTGFGHQGACLLVPIGLAELFDRRCKGVDSIVGQFKFLEECGDPGRVGFIGVVPLAESAFVRVGGQAELGSVDDGLFELP